MHNSAALCSLEHISQRGWYVPCQRETNFLGNLTTHLTTHLITGNLLNIVSYSFMAARLLTYHSLEYAFLVFTVKEALGQSRISTLARTGCILAASTRARVCACIR